MDKQMIEEMYQEFLDYKASTPCEVFSYRGMCENFIKLGYTKIDYKNINNIDLMIFAGKRFAQIPDGAVVLTEDNAEELGNMIVESPQMQKAMKRVHILQRIVHIGISSYSMIPTMENGRIIRLMMAGGDMIRFRSFIMRVRRNYLIIFCVLVKSGFPRHFMQMVGDLMWQQTLVCHRK